MKEQIFIQKIQDEKAPERLQGKTIKAILHEKQLRFEMEMPENLTPNELGYFEYIVGEWVDQIKTITGVDMTRKGGLELKP